MSEAEKENIRLAQRAIRRGELQAARYALRLIGNELGLRRTMVVLLRVLSNKLRGEPFSRLAPPKDMREKLSRRQAADLILLDRELRKVLSEERATAICRAIVFRGAIPFLEKMMGDWGPEQLKTDAAHLVERFFNAHGDAALDGEALKFNVRQCDFVDLLPRVAAAHLLPLFCEADHAFFDRADNPIAFERTHTLAQGATHCDFVFRIRRKS